MAQPSAGSSGVRVPFAGRAALLVVAIVALGVLAWPDGGPAHRMPDTLEYLAWPEPVSADGQRALGPRPPAYPLVLRSVGTGPALVALQVGLAAAGFAALGGVLAGWPGALLGAALTLAPELRVFAFMGLTESVSFSLLALLATIAIAAIRRFSWGLLAIWSLLLLFWALLRPVNALAIPVLLLPWLSWLHSGELRGGPSAGLQRATAPRAFVAAAVAAAAMAISIGVVERSEFWRVNYLSAYMERVIGHPEAVAYFEAAGMPTPVRLSSPAFEEWYEQSGRRAYQGWVASRPESYVTAWRWLRPGSQRQEIWRRYVDAVGEARVLVPGWLEVERLLMLTAPPLGVWAFFVLLPLAIGLRERRLDAPALWPAALAVGAYVECFVAYHGSAAEEVRHTLGASILMRLAFVVALAGVVGGVVRARRAATSR